MDVASVLEEYLADVASLPGDLAFILGEIKVKDEKLVEAQRRIQQRDAPLQKLARTHDLASEGAKEQASYPRIRSDFQECITLQQEKTRLAVMGLYLVSKQVGKLDDDVARLEREGLLPPVTAGDDEYAALTPAAAEPTPPPRSRKSMSAGGSESASRRLSRADSASSRERTPSAAPAVPGGAAAAAGGTALKTEAAPADVRPHGVAAAAGPGPAAGLRRPLTPEVRESLNLGGARVSLKRTHGSPRQRPPGKEDSDESFCFCKKGSLGNMIACDSDNCEIEWFHWECVGLTEDPKGSWFCPQCREKIKRR